jgi:ectoine hydroxylase-related dioxygenase (phytanoyl-CoA dioxygenase family)
MLSENQINQFNENGYLIIKNAIDNNLITRCLGAYERMREKCEKYSYLYYRKFSDIAVNDIYAIENIFHQDIFEEDIFESIMKSKVLEIAQILMGEKNIFLSLNRLHCTKNISHSGTWHRDGTASGIPREIDEMLKENENLPIHVQATLPFFKENGFYIIPGSHKHSDNFIKTAEILGTKKILKDETRLEIHPGDLMVFNPFIIHRGTVKGRKKNQRAHIHMRFTKSIKSNLATRNKLDNTFFKNERVYNFANDNWKYSFNLKLDDPEKWYGAEIVQKRFDIFKLKSFLKLGLIGYNRLMYELSKFLPISQRKIENIKLIKYPYLK